jgi:hypothetical protein
MQRWLAELPWSLVAVACLTLGLAPFTPPHLFEKLQMLARGQLRRPIDWFDLVFHAAPWLVALAKGLLSLRRP